MPHSHRGAFASASSASDSAVALPIAEPVAESDAFAAMVRQIYQSLDIGDVSATLARLAAELLGTHGARVDLAGDGVTAAVTTFGDAPASPSANRIAVPLTVNGRPAGELTVFGDAHREFTDEDAALLTNLASHGVVAIGNAWRFRDASDTARHAEALAAAEQSGRERERALADAMHQTEKLAALGELVAGVAHELNNPLTGISMFAQLLLDESLGEDQRESVRMIKREADRAVGVIRDLLAFSRKTGPRLVAVDLNAVITQTLRLRAYSLQTAGVQVRSELDPKLPAIPGDDRKLQQVLLNLIVNAEYAMHRQESRELAVCTIWEDGPDGGRVLIEVMDTGTGMAPELLKHIFEPFFTTKPAGVGTGLGLSVSYGIVHAHGGTITVRSTPGAGSTFVVTLPIRSQQLPSASPSPARAGRRSRPSAPAEPPADASAPAPSAAPSPSPSARASGRGPRQ
jgi:signal transduction histidine kinase